MDLDFTGLNNTQRNRACGKGKGRVFGAHIARKMCVFHTYVQIRVRIFDFLVKVWSTSFPERGICK